MRTKLSGLLAGALITGAALLGLGASGYSPSTFITRVSQLVNDAGYATAAAVTSAVSNWSYHVAVSNANLNGKSIVNAATLELNEQAAPSVPADGAVKLWLSNDSVFDNHTILGTVSGSRTNFYDLSTVDLTADSLSYQSLYVYNTTNADGSAYDYSGNGNSMSNMPSVGSGLVPTVIGTNWGGREEIGFYNGGASYWKVITANTPNSTNGAVGCWIKSVAAPANKFIMGGYYGSLRTYLYCNASSKFSAGFGGQDQNTIKGTTSMVSNQWYFCVLTWNSSTVSLYLDGIREYSAARSGNPATNGIQMSTANNDSFGAPGAYTVAYQNYAFMMNTEPTSNQVYTLWQRTQPGNQLTH